MINLKDMENILMKIVKMNYLQCQKIERNKCESNMIFLGFVFYREIKGGYNPGYS